jgi:hypothetical protein
MLFAATFQEQEIIAEFRTKSVRGIARDVEAAASCGTIVGERGDDYVAAAANGVPELCDVASAIVRAREKVECRTIVPHIERSCR